MSGGEDIEKFKKFLYEVLRPDYLKSVKEQEDIAAERHEYEILLVTLNKIMETKSKQLTTRFNLGHHVFANAEIDNCETVIVKMVGDVFAELKLPRAVAFIERKIELLEKRIERVEEVSNKIRAHMDYVLTSIADYEKLL